MTKAVKMSLSNLKGFSEILEKQKKVKLPLHRQRILLYGEPKIGKTILAKQFPNALFLDVEQGTIGYDVMTWETLLKRDRVTNPINSWTDILQATDVLENKLSGKADGVLVIDPVNKVFQICRRHVLETGNNGDWKRKGYSHESDVPHGKAWGMVRQEFQQWIVRLTNMPFGIIFIAHEREKEIETRSEKFVRTEPFFDGPVNVVAEVSRHIWHLETRREKNSENKFVDINVVRTKNDKNVFAGETYDSTCENPIFPPFVYPATYDRLNELWNESK